MKHVTSVAGRELRSLFVSPVAYGVLSLFSVLAGVFFILLPVGLPLVFAPLGVFVSFMQTFVFTMLSMVYIAGALEHGH